jgi:hypothetical protein
MSSIRVKGRRWFADTCGGTSFVEYLILVCLLALAGSAGFRFLASGIESKANEATSALSETRANAAFSQTAAGATRSAEPSSAMVESSSLLTPATTFGIVAALLAAGFGFFIWMRSKNARGELATASGAGDARQP